MDRRGERKKKRERERGSERRSWISILESVGRRAVHVFTGDMRERVRSAVEQDPRDVWPVARKHGAMVLAYSTRPDDEVRKGIVLARMFRTLELRGESLATESGQSVADPCY